MKRLLLAVAIMFVFSGVAGAVSFVEEYTGRQAVSQGQSYSFGFDFWYDNSVYNVGTNSSLVRTSDASGAFGDWDSASLYIDFASFDWEKDVPSIQLNAYNGWGGTAQSFNLGTVTNPWFSMGQFSFHHVLSAYQLSVFDAWGWGNVVISAQPLNCCGWPANDFYITKVGMKVSQVPEPVTLLLFGSGLAGLALYRRRSMNKS